MKVASIVLGMTLLIALFVGTGFAQQATTLASVASGSHHHELDQNPALRTSYESATNAGTSASAQNSDPEHFLSQNPALLTGWHTGKSPSIGRIPPTSPAGNGSYLLSSSGAK